MFVSVCELLLSPSRLGVALDFSVISRDRSSESLLSVSILKGALWLTFGQLVTFGFSAMIRTRRLSNATRSTDAAVLFLLLQDVGGSVIPVAALGASAMMRFAMAWLLAERSAESILRYSMGKTVALPSSTYVKIPGGEDDRCCGVGRSSRGK